MIREKTKLNYFLLKLFVVATHLIFLGAVWLNGNYSSVFEVIKLAVIVIATDIIYFVITGVLEQDTYTIDHLMVLIVNIGLIFQSCFGEITFNVKHFITILAGMVSYHIGYLFTRNSFKAEKLKPYYYGGVGILMVVILLFTGSRSMWINFGSFSIQPSEFIKPLLVLICATSLYRQQTKKKISIFTVNTDTIYMLAIAAVILLLQWWCRDLGSIPTFAAVVGCAIINRICYPRARLSKKKIGAIIGCALTLAITALILAPSYVKDRLYVDIWADRYGNGYQQCEALIGIAEGGWLGKGPGYGRLHEIAAYDTDIVFSAVSEEWGMFAAIMFVLLVLVMLATPLINSPKCYYHGNIAVGVVAVFIVQMSLNIFGSCNLIPFTGVTFPLLSNGGTSMVTSGFLIGMLKATQSPVFIRNIIEKTPERQVG